MKNPSILINQRRYLTTKGVPRNGHNTKEEIKININEPGTVFNNKGVVVTKPRKKEKSIVMNQRRYSITEGLWSQNQGRKKNQ